MKINDFIGKIVINSKNGTRYRLCEIASSYISIVQDCVSEAKYPKRYVFETINGDPVSDGRLVFEDESLKEPFKIAFDNYCRSKDAYWEDYGYWFRKD